MGAKIKLDESRILDLYNKGLNDVKIGKELDVSKHTIRRFRAEKGLIPNKRTSINKDIFIKSYKENLNDVQIGKIMNVSAFAIKNHRDSLKLKSNYKSEQRYDYFDIFSDTTVLECFVGTLFGDASIYRFPQGGNIGGSFSHSKKQLAFVKYKHSIMNPICNGIFPKKVKNSIINGREIKPTLQYNVNFKSNPKFEFFFKEMYNENNDKTFITENVLKYFSELSLAIFFMDDGYNHKSGSYFCTDNFEKDSIILFQKFLLKKWNLKSSIHGKRIYIKSESKSNFIKLIDRYIIDELKYKTGVYKSDKLLEHPEEDNQQPTQNLNGSGRFND